VPRIPRLFLIVKGDTDVRAHKSCRPRYRGAEPGRGRHRGGRRPGRSCPAGPGRPHVHGGAPGRVHGGAPGLTPDQQANEGARIELCATGERAPKRTAQTLDVLTAREAHIAPLAGQGASNPEIAAQLYISPATVAYHLRKVFAALGISSPLVSQFQQRSMPTMKRRGWDARRLTALLDRPSSPASSDSVQRADRSLNVLLGKWALGSVRPFADVSRSSRSFAGG
jgi:DNA-binding CsgD family transcriptional regulator